MPRKVTSTNGRHVFVHGSRQDSSRLTGLYERTDVVPRLSRVWVLPNSSDGNDISVLLLSNRLQITADVDDKGLEKLEQMLAK